MSVTYWGDIGSKNSVPAGRPNSAISIRTFLAISMPLLILKVSFISGSFISPFHPTVVRGFSKYTLIIINKFSLKFLCSLESFLAYSSALSGS